MRWSIAKARKRFSGLLRKTQSEPQPIYNRDKLVAIVISGESFQEYSAWSERRKGRSIADAFDELRKIVVEEEYELQIPAREDPRNDLTPLTVVTRNVGDFEGCGVSVLNPFSS